jgi:uncharacterized protein
MKLCKKVILILSLSVLISPLLPIQATANINAGEIYENVESILYRNVTIYAPAVASTSSGYVGVISTITVTIQGKGSGRVFVDTLPLAQIDMQGSARLAVKVASTLVQNNENSTVNPSNFDYFFVVRTDAPIIGGPSAGAVMTAATVALLENLSLDKHTVMTGMINPDGSIGPIGGIPQKIDAAYTVGTKRFLIPQGQATYTEMVTTTESNGGVTRITTRPVVRNIKDYVIEKGYDIEIVETGNIYQVLENFTGYDFYFEDTKDEITTEKYLQAMEPLASHLIQNASEMYSIAWDKFNNSNIPNHFPDYSRENIYSELEKAKKAFEDANKWYGRSLYYTSISKSFQSLIPSRFVIYSCEYFNSDNESYLYLERLLLEAEEIYTNASNEAETEKINGFIALQSIGTAQRRASEAKTYLDFVKTEIDTLKNPSDVLSFLNNIAFIVERSNSVNWWIYIGTKFEEIGNFSYRELENLALEYIGEAQQAYIYSNMLVREIEGTYTGSRNYLTTAELLIETARDNYNNGFYAAALFEALEALVRANLAIEIIGTNPQEKIDYARDTAGNNIARNRRQGIEPLLAVSYYEFAESLNEEEEYNSALIYYKFSSMIAGALSFTNVSIGTSPSRYVGIPEYIPPMRKTNFFELISLVAFLTFLLIGTTMGFGLGLIIAGLFTKESEKKEKTNNIVYKKQRYKGKYSYPNDQIPRSIEDYYRKNK